MMPLNPQVKGSRTDYVQLPVNPGISPMPRVEYESGNSQGQTVSYTFERPVALDRVRDYLGCTTKFVTIGDLLYITNPPNDFPTGNNEYPIVIELATYRRNKALPSPTRGLHVARLSENQLRTENHQFAQVRDVHRQLDELIRAYHREWFDGKLEISRK